MADAPKLLGTDTLRQAYPKFNQAIDNANAALTKAITSETNSTNAVSTANQAKAKSDETQQQLDTIVIESGTSDAETLQARGGFPLLKDRLDSTDAQLASNLQDLNSREINIMYPPAPLMPAYADNINDDAPIINAIITYLGNKGGGTVYIPNGRYYTGSEITLKDNVYLVGDSSTILDAKGNSDLTQIKTPLISGVPVTITATVKKGDKTIQATNQVKKGDLVEISSTKRFTEEWDGGIEVRPYYNQGELLKVAESTSTSITFTEPVSFDFALANISFAKSYTPTKNVLIDNIVLTRNYSETGNGRGIYITQTNDFVLRNIKTENTNSDGIVIDRSILGELNIISGVGGSSALGLNYLVNLNTGTKNVSVSNVHGNGFRHVTTAGGANITSMNNNFLNVSGENTVITTIDTHANTLNYIYENCHLDYGLNISGKGHIVRNIHSKSGSFVCSEGGYGITFENIVFEDCTQFRVASSTASAINFLYRNVEIYVGILTSAIHWGSKPKNIIFDGFKLINKAIRGVQNNTEADSLYASGIFRGLTLYEGFSANNVEVEGFPIGLAFYDSNATAKNVKLVNCGWKTTKFGQPNTVVNVTPSAYNGILDGIQIACTNNNLDLTSCRLFTFGTGSATPVPFTLLNASNGVSNIKEYQYGLVGGRDHVIFMQNVRPTVTTGTTSFVATGKFIYNTLIADN